MSEGMGLAASAKAAVEENAINANSSLSLGWTSPTATTNVSSIAIDGTNGEITVSYTARVAVTSANTLIMVPRSAGSALAVSAVPTGGSINWTCTGGTLATKNRPASCR
ncbi:MAG: pilin [Burkholderiales bacterium]|nr:pilin [Burkholderiales bacterium]